MTAADAEACAVAAAADIICSLRGADLAGWTPPWGTAAAKGKEVVVVEEEEELAWPTVARGKRSRSSRRRSPSGSGSAATKGRWARGSPASPLDYSGGSGASTSGGDYAHGGAHPFSGQGGPCRTAPADPTDPASPARRTETTEEDEAAGDSAAGAVADGGERWPSRGDGGVAESLHGVVQGKLQARDKVRAVKQAKRNEIRGAASKAAA